MNNKTRQEIEVLLSQPDKLLKKKPFYRRLIVKGQPYRRSGKVDLTDSISAELPNVEKVLIRQEEYMRELDVHSHRVLFDENVPAITVKDKSNGYLEIEQYRMAVPFQQIILGKQVRHLCVNPMGHTLLNPEPTDSQQHDFIRFKQGWMEKNMEGVKTKFVTDQKSYGDAALLFFMDDDKKLRTKNINFADGYVIITHKNDSGQHILECLYYAVTDADGNTVTYLDCYDDEKITRFTKELTMDGNTGALLDGGWLRHESVTHGFSENPLVTKRGAVAWDKGQPTIESYEALFNTFIVIQKRHGWGALYVKGQFNQDGKKIAGSVVLNDTSGDATADAKYLTPPSPQNMIETLEHMEHTIQKATGTTFILPKDIRISGDASGLAIEMTQELDMATAQDGVIEWQNAANKMARLFREGFAKELVNTGEYPDAVTGFSQLRVHSELRVWKPKSEEAHNQMLVTVHGAGGISKQTFVEKNTISTPDEIMRIKKEHDEELAEAQAQTAIAAQNAQKTSEETIIVE